MLKKQMTAAELAARKELEAKRAAEKEVKRAERKEALKKKLDMVSKADPKTMSVEQKSFLESLSENLTEAVSEALNEAISEDDIADTVERLEEIANALDKVDAALSDAGLKEFKANIEEKLLKVYSMVEKAPQNGNSGGGNSRKTIRDIVAQKAQDIQMIGKDRPNVRFEFKMFQKDAPDFMGVTNSVSPQPNVFLPAPTIAAGVVPVMQTQPKILDAVTKKPITTPSLVTINRTPVDGDFEWTAEGALKPFLKFGYETEMVNVRKLPARTKIAREALQDITFIQSDTEMILEDTYKRKLSSEILNGDGQKAPGGTDYRIFGLRYYAPGYVQVCLNESIENPGISEVLKAAATQIRNMGAEGKLTAFVNPCDWAIEIMRKDNNGALLDVSKLLDGITIIETGEIEPGEFFIGDLSVYALYVYEDFEIFYGYSNDDFDLNLVSLVAEGRVFGFVSANNIGAFCADSIDAVKTLIRA